jgi:chemotaxis protein methyltransferase CheR
MRRSSSGTGPGTCPEPELVLSEAEFAKIRELLHSGFGIKLSEEKRTLVMGRLQKLLREKGNIGFGEYYNQVVSDRSGREMSELINRLSTNHTFFNREKAHFDDFLTASLPEAAERARRRGARDIRVWCAAASTGEEPYMLAMLMREFFGQDFKNWDLGLLATDISEKALAVAKDGVYSAERMRDLPVPLKERYFRPHGSDFEAIPSLKQDLTYRRLNLINPEYPFKKMFEVIFCRNVMIYFDTPTKEAVVARMARHLVPGGHLFIGHAETLGRETEHYEYVRPALYRRKADR